MKSEIAASKDGNQNQEFLSIKELAARLPYKEGTIRNMMSKGEFVRGIHYVKPKGRVVFRWSRIVDWMVNEGEVRFRKK